MDKSVQYAQVMSNFDSAYNAGPNLVHHPPVIYMPTSSFSSHRNPSMSTSLNSSNPKFNLDLYQPNEYLYESIDYPSPSSSVIIHHRPVYSPPPLPPSQVISKLRQINDELCHTLAHSELINHSQPSPSHYHIHHNPISHETYRSRPRSKRDSSSSSSSSTESDQPVPKKHNARITYKAHIPRRQNSLSKLDQLLISTSDAYSQDDPMTLDLYPTRDQGFVNTIRNRPDNQTPWLADTSPIRRNSYSEASTYRTPRTPNAPYYDNEPIKTKSRLADFKERPRSSSVKSRFRPDTAPNPLRQSTSSFFSTGGVWRPSGSIKHPKFMGSHSPPSKPKPSQPEARWNPAGTKNKTKHFRAFDPGTKSLPDKAPEPVWRPTSKTLPKKHHRYFEPTLKPELTASIKGETEPVLQKQATKPQKILPSADPKFKTRIANAESKVKSAWDPTLTAQEPKPRPVKTAAIPPKTKVKSVPTQPFRPIKNTVSAPPINADTGRSSLNDIPPKPLFQSTPRNQSIVDENDDLADDLFENESQISEQPKKPVISHTPPQIEKTPSKLPNVSAPEPDKGTKSTIKDGVLIHGNDAANNRTPEINNNGEEEALNDHSLQASPTPPKRKASSPKPDNRDDVSIVGDEDDITPNEHDTDGDGEGSFEMNKSLTHADKANTNISKKDNILPPSTPTRAEKPSQSPLSKSPDQNAQQSPVNSKKNNQQLPSPSPPAATKHEADDFFD